MLSLRLQNGAHDMNIIPFLAPAIYYRSKLRTEPNFPRTPTLRLKSS